MEEEARRREWLRSTRLGQDEDVANLYRDLLVAAYGDQPGRAVFRAEVFQTCPFGRRAHVGELRHLFPVVAAEAV